MRGHEAGRSHKNVHHSTACRQRVENDIKQDDILSKKLAEAEERKNQFLARQIQASDQRRVEERHAEEQAEQQGPTGDTSLRSVSTVGFLDTQNASATCACARNLSIVGTNESRNLSIACAVNTSEGQNEPSAHTSLRSVSSGGSHEHLRTKYPKDTICSWILHHWPEVLGRSY